MWKRSRGLNTVLVHYTYPFWSTSLSHPLYQGIPETDVQCSGVSAVQVQCRTQGELETRSTPPDTMTDCVTVKVSDWELSAICPVSGYNPSLLVSLFLTAHDSNIFGCQKLNGTQTNAAVYFVSLREEERGFEWRLPLPGVCQILPQAQEGL